MKSCKSFDDTLKWGIICPDNSASRNARKLSEIYTNDKCIKMKKIEKYKQ